MNIDEIGQLIAMLEGSQVTELVLETDQVKLALKKGGAMPSAQEADLLRTGEVTPLLTAAAQTAVPKEGSDIKLAEVTAPMVGTFYSAPSPESPPFVSIGDHVNVGQILCIVEAMKLMNEIKSEISGVITDILVENGDPLEFDQRLFLIQEG